MIADPSKIVVSASSQDDKLRLEKMEAETKQECEKNIKKLKGALSASEFEELNALNQILEIPRMEKLMGSFLDDSTLEVSLKTYGQITPTFLTACTPDMEERKRVKKEILPHIFNGNPQGIESLFNRKEGAPHPKMLLTKASYDEGYFSNKLNRFVCFSHWKGVSPLQAAYLCGDGPFLGRKLLAYIINDKSLDDDAKGRMLKEARQQLQELLNRNGVNNTAATAAAVSHNNPADSKENAELRHGFSANTENECAEDAEFLAPIKKLIKAYNAYLSQFDSSIPEKKWTEIENLWEQVGECHKRLSHYAKQEFFGSIPFYPEPAFDTEPSRGACRYLNGDLLDLDTLGIRISHGLYKGIGSGVAADRGRGNLWGSVAREDSAAFSRLSELREADLRSTINCLQSLEDARTLIANITPVANTILSS